MNVLVIYGFLLLSSRLIDCKPSLAGRRNWALGGKTSHYPSSEARPSKLAVDGDISNDFKLNSCSQTGKGDTPWWRVRLNNYVAVDEVFIVNRGDCCGEALDKFTIYVIRDPWPHTICYKNTEPLVNGQAKAFPCRFPVVGNDVLIQRDKKSVNLTLCEVQIFGKLVKDLTRLTLNWAIGMPVLQSTTYNEKNSKASNAIDGNLDSNFHHGSCSCTAAKDMKPWWMVGFGKYITVHLVTVYNRQDCCAYRLRNFYIEVLSGKVDNDPPVCYHQKEPAGGVLQAYCVKPLTGSWLKIRKDVIDPNDDMITLCEVVVTATQEVSDPVYKLRRDNFAVGLRIESSQPSSEEKPELAVDGDIYILQRKMTCMRTGKGPGGIWIKVYFTAMRVEAVVMVLTDDCCGVKDLVLRVDVGDSRKCGTTTPFREINRVVSVRCPDDVYGDYVKISRTPEVAYLRLCEVEVYNNGTNWAMGHPVHVDVDLPVKSYNDGDLSNGFDLKGCPIYRGHTVTVNLNKLFIHVDGIYVITPIGPKSNAMLENTKTTIKNLKNNTQALCKADRGTFVLGTPNKIVCNGEISNQIIFENSPGLPTLGICEISIVARYAFYQ